MDAPYEKVSPEPTGDFLVACEGDQRSSHLERPSTASDSRAGTSARGGQQADGS